jgi:hypothetical protein
MTTLYLAGAKNTGIGVLFIYLFALLVSDRYRQALITLRISKSSMIKTLSSSKWKRKASDP